MICILQQWWGWLSPEHLIGYEKNYIFYYVIWNLNALYAEMYDDFFIFLYSCNCSLMGMWLGK